MINDNSIWANKHPKNEWISVKNYLPKQDYNGWNIPNVVYWFPMPKLPKK